MNKRDRIANKIFLTAIGIGLIATGLSWLYNCWLNATYGIFDPLTMIIPIGFWVFALVIILLARKKNKPKVMGQWKEWYRGSFYSPYLLSFFSSPWNDIIPTKVS